MIHLYRLLGFFVYPLFFLMALFSKKTRAYLFGRKSELPKSTNIKPVWIHASSGEFEHAKFLIKKLKGKHPLQKIVVSYSSPSYFHTIEKFEFIDGYFPMPVDLKAPIHSIIKRVNPKAVLFARTDVWPELAHQLKGKKIPSFVFAKMEKDKKVFFSSSLSKLTYKKIDHISFVSEEDKTLFIKNNGIQDNLTVDGDPRIEEVLMRASHLEKKEHTSGKTIVLGSIWKEDLNNISKALTEKIKSEKLSQIIAAPHDPSIKHINEIKAAFKGLTHSLLSENKDTQVITVDRLGVLFELYSKAHISFVGGSFKKRVHSVIEPLSHGVPVLVGPYIDNNREAKAYSEDQSLFVRKCATEQEFKAQLEELLELNKSEYDGLTNEILESLISSKGASDKIIQKIEAVTTLE